MGSKKLGPIVASELQAELEKNAEWVAKREATEIKRAAQRELIRQEEAPIVNDLNAAGIRVEFVSDLVNRRTDYLAGLPVLMLHLRLKYSDRTLEMIARSLATPEAAEYWAELLEMYKKEPSIKPDGKTSDLKDGLAVALSVLGTKHPEEIIELCSDPSNGPSRVTLIQAIRRKKSDWVNDALDRLIQDPGLHTELSRWNRKKTSQ